ncbi:hypothetical protein AQUCO_07700023v1 [Aquilegia coerulea]|uniref:Rhodanese domain-containing protein n=1 Tax=Aquilegia coerulea TaxID=218851 RepID=A0A2G5C894_AQUCA|nr:hypothetical protein AQUCO_07700023v1 [Aquilegia coerulea]
MENKEEEEEEEESQKHYNLGVLLWKEEEREKAVEQFVISAKLNPNNGSAFRYLGHYYSKISIDKSRALKCYTRAVNLNPDDFEAGEALCDLLDEEGKRSLEIVLCRDTSEKSPKAFWAFRRLGYLQVEMKKWSEAVQSLQNAIRGYPSCADLWEVLGLAYQRLGMLTAALKSYARAIELADTNLSLRVFALVESGNLLLMLGNFRKGIEHFRLALEVVPQNAAANFGLASGLLGLSKECVSSGAFSWGALLLEEAASVAKATTCLIGNASCVWKLLGDIQIAYAKCLPWTYDDKSQSSINFEAFGVSIIAWKRKCLFSAVSASHSYQRALRLNPWQANIYIDIAISVDLIHSLEEEKQDQDAWKLPSKISLGGLLLEKDNSDFWVALGCLSRYTALKQHALIRSLQLDVSLAVAWAYLGKLYRKEGEKTLTMQAFDHARSIDPSLALPWAGMSANIDQPGGYTHAEAYESCLRAVQISPLAEFQIGLGKLAFLSGHLSSPQVFGAIRQAVQRSPHFSEVHNLNGLISEARSDYQSAVVAYKLARCATNISEGPATESHLFDISVNMVRALCLSGDALEAARECEDLQKEGMLDSMGLQIYAVSLWQLGKHEQALSVARLLAANVSTMDPLTAAASISLICKLLYHISGQESTMTSILRMPKDLLKNSKISFIVSALDALDHSNQLKQVVSSTRTSLTSYEEISGMHSLIALSKSMRNGTDQSLGSQSGIAHLRKFLHVYPNSSTLRNQLGYLLLCSKEWKDIHTAVRCIVIDPPGHPVQSRRSALEILGAAGMACSEIGTTYPGFSFPTCKDEFMHGAQIIQQLQRWLHQEPGNHNARYLLVLNLLQKAREERYPRHLCVMLERLVHGALSSKIYSENIVSFQYQKLQLLLCASEISFQSRDYVSCIDYATHASRLSVPDNVLFFVHLFLCRVYGSQGDITKLREEYTKCLYLKTGYPVGWIYLKFLESKYRLQVDFGTVDTNLKECLEEKSCPENKWTGIFEVVRCQNYIWDQNFLQAEEIMQSSLLAGSSESCLFLCYGAICLQLARMNWNSHILELAVKCLTKAQETSSTPLPFISVLLAQAQASLGSKAKWERSLRLEWYSWPPEMRPAELYFQMYLLARHQKTGLDSSSNSDQRSNRLILRAIHLNPSCSRYWKLLCKIRNE